MRVHVVHTYPLAQTAYKSSPAATPNAARKWMGLALTENAAPVELPVDCGELPPKTAVRAEPISEVAAPIAPPTALVTAPAAAPATEVAALTTELTSDATVLAAPAAAEVTDAATPNAIALAWYTAKDFGLVSTALTEKTIPVSQWFFGIVCAQ